MAYTYKELNLFSDDSIVKMAQEGSSTAYEFLIQKYREMAKKKARKYYITGGDNDDVMQEGMIGIFKAIRDFDKEAGTPFAAFAELCVDRQIQTAITGANRDKHRPLNESVSLSEDEESEGEKINIPASKGDEPERLALLKEAIDALFDEAQEKLSPLEQSVFSGIMQGKPYTEIAEELGKSPKSIDNATQRIKKKIKFRLLED
ncbi:MAG: sigma-70 family RNA polymerase sigma factor [Firmicutes bacterium]|nr:sigma-70 family RNA polymerase sigma factor [Bacillota bacterium]